MTEVDDRSLDVKAVAAAFMTLASIVVILRCYVRGWLVKGFGLDDWAMIIAMLFYLMFSGCMIGGALYGTGRKFEALTAHQRVTAMKYWWLCEIAYCFSSVSCKISVCFFLLRITIRRLHIWILYAVMIVTVFVGLVFMFIMLLQCKPLEYFWTRTAFDPDIKGTCIDVEIIITMTYLYSAVAALCDFTVGILPIFIVRKLHMRKQTKMAVAGILSMACIASSAVVVRIPYVKTFREFDFLYATVEIALWSNIETGLGITAGSLATLRPLVKKWLGSTRDQDYRASPFPGPSGSRLPGGPSRDQAYPLGSLSDKTPGRLHPDKLEITVTTVHTQHESEERWPDRSSANSSEERLTTERGGRRPTSADMGLGIHQRTEVTHNSMNNAKSASIMERV